MRDVLPWEWLLDIPGRVACAARLSEENAHACIRTPPERTPPTSATEKLPQELDERKEGVDTEVKRKSV